MSDIDPTTLYPVEEWHVSPKTFSELHELSQKYSGFVSGLSDGGFAAEVTRRWGKKPYTQYKLIVHWDWE